jgi:hypothetical protein
MIPAELNISTCNLPGPAVPTCPIVRSNIISNPPGVTRETFPPRNYLIQIVNEQKFNSLLSSIKNKIDIAHSVNLNYIKMYTPDLINYSDDIIKSIRIFLEQQGYSINELEDNNNTAMGWKMSW